MKNITIYIDESGTLPDPKDQVVIIAAVGTKLPENFALLCWVILEDCLLFYQGNIKEVIFDRHFHKKSDQEKFNSTLIQLLKQKLNFIHTDSQKDFQVNAADMIAGSLLWLKTGKESSFYEIIKEKIISERVISWKNLRAMFFNKKSR